MKYEPTQVCMKVAQPATVDDLIDSVDDEAMKIKRVIPKAELEKIRNAVRLECVEVIKKPTIIARTR